MVTIYHRQSNVLHCLPISFYYSAVVLPSIPLDSTTDVIFLLDSSMNVTQELLTHQKEFIKNLAKVFQLSPTGPRGSAIIYGKAAYVLAAFNDRQFSFRVDRARLLNQQRKIDKALDEARKTFEQRGRRGRKVIVLLVAGRQAHQLNAESLRKSVKQLKRLKTNSYVVTIGREPDVRVLSLVVDSVRDIFSVISSKDLGRNLRSIAQYIQQKRGKVFVIG